MKKYVILIMSFVLSGCQFFASSFEVPNAIDSVILGPKSTYIITNNQSLYVLGSHGSNSTAEPKAIMSDIKHVYNDWFTTLVLKSDGTLWEWGSSRVFSRLSQDQNDEPIKVLEDVKYMWGNQSRLIYVLKNDDSLWAIGHDECRVKPYNPNESNAPLKLNKVLEGVKDVSVQVYSSNAFVQMLDGSVRMWGTTQVNQKNDVLSLFVEEGVTCQSEPLEVQFDVDFEKIIYTNGALLYVTKQNELYGLGNNENNYFSNSSEVMISRPMLMAYSIKDVQSSPFFIHVLTQSDDLFVVNNSLEVSNSNVILFNTSHFIQFLEDVKIFTVGSANTMAIQNDGSIYGWGSNEYQQLGGNRSKDITKPTKIGQSRP